MEILRDFFSDWTVFITLISINIICLIVYIVDVNKNNAFLGTLMKIVWGLTIFYSGILGLVIYYYSGRAQIKRDSIWRRSFRSVSHCYSGCGMGEIIGITVTVGIMALSTWWVAGVTFALAYAFGFALTAGPLMQEGVKFKTAMWDSFTSETASITVMEIVAIGTDIWLAGEATMSDALFWNSLLFSLTCGLIAAYPVNVLLIKFGIKEGMHNPKHMAEMAQGEGEHAHAH